ncbi:hypothetical protein DRO91_05575 [Candidatus Heimdallarchaeota archaeon]|nr:MAG: hypothetical protein DRO91_05575 [Candidatus Heimdallarchaeota archaeon]
MNDKNLAEWLANAVSGTLQQEAFYREVFKQLLENEIVFVDDLKGFNVRSKSRWLIRLGEGNQSIKGLDILRHNREGFQGKTFYKWSPHFLGINYSLYKKVKLGV